MVSMPMSAPVVLTRNNCSSTCYPSVSSYKNASFPTLAPASNTTYDNNSTKLFFSIHSGDNKYCSLDDDFRSWVGQQYNQNQGYSTSTKGCTRVNAENIIRTEERMKFQKLRQRTFRSIRKIV